MKLLLDEGLPRSAAHRLREAGHDAVHTGEIGLASAEDPLLLARACEEDRVVITLDADFHTHLALSRAMRPSVIRIRIEGLKGEAMASLILDVLRHCDEEVQYGVVVSVMENGIRIRRLPLP